MSCDEQLGAAITARWSLDESGTDERETHGGSTAWRGRNSGATNIDNPELVTLLTEFRESADDLETTPAAPEQRRQAKRGGL